MIGYCLKHRLHAPCGQLQNAFTYRGLPSTRELPAKKAFLVCVFMRDIFSFLHPLFYLRALIDLKKVEAQNSSLWPAPQMTQLRAPTDHEEMFSYRSAVTSTNTRKIWLAGWLGQFSGSFPVGHRTSPERPSKAMSLDRTKELTSQITRIAWKLNRKKGNLR